MSETQETQLTKKDFVSDQAVRWCPGCGDYAILAQAQKQAVAVAYHYAKKAGHKIPKEKLHYQ